MTLGGLLINLAENSLETVLELNLLPFPSLPLSKELELTVIQLFSLPSPTLSFFSTRIARLHFLRNLLPVFILS